MSKHEKLLAKLARRPTPTDFRWDDLVTVAEHLGFTVSCGSGSHHTFQHVGGLTFTMSRTHPSGLLKIYQVRNALDAFAKAKVHNNEPKH